MSKPTDLNTHLDDMDREAILINAHIRDRKASSLKEESALIMKPTEIKRRFTSILSSLEDLITEYDTVSTLCSIYNRDKSEKIMNDLEQTLNNNNKEIIKIKNDLRQIQHEVSCTI